MGNIDNCVEEIKITSDCFRWRLEYIFIKILKRYGTYGTMKHKKRKWRKNKYKLYLEICPPALKWSHRGVVWILLRCRPRSKAQSRLKSIFTFLSMSKGNKKILFHLIFILIFFSKYSYTLKDSKANIKNFSLTLQNRNKDIKNNWSHLKDLQWGKII